MPSASVVPLPRSSLPSPPLPDALPRIEDQRAAKRRALRTLLRPYAQPGYAPALMLVGVDALLYLTATAAVIFAAWPGKLLASVIVGLAMARLFVLGHDACHQSLTPSRTLNRWLTQVLFLPTLCPASIWAAGHNVAHHGFTNWRSRDIPWVPLSPAQYLALPHWRRQVYRMYRAWWGAALYYGVHVWWRLQVFPRGKVRPAFTRDSWLVTLFLVAQGTLYASLALATGQSPWLLLLLGIALPFVVWLQVAAFVFYVHHTDTDATWFDAESTWREAQPDLVATHSVRLPLRFDLLLHNVMQHTAHHVNAAIPSYRLAAAQRALERAFPAEVTPRRLSFARYLAITRQCQLYDSVTRGWRTCAEVETAVESAAPA